MARTALYRHFPFADEKMKRSPSIAKSPTEAIMPASLFVHDVKETCRDV
jgi:hypothetical protein